MKTYRVPLFVALVAIGLLTSLFFFDIPKGFSIFIATLSGVFLSMALSGSIGKKLYKVHMDKLAAMEQETLERYFKDE